MQTFELDANDIIDDLARKEIQLIQRSDIH